MRALTALERYEYLPLRQQDELQQNDEAHVPLKPRYSQVYVGFG